MHVFLFNHALYTICEHGVGCVNMSGWEARRPSGHQSHVGSRPATLRLPKLDGWAWPHGNPWETLSFLVRRSCACMLCAGQEPADYLGELELLHRTRLRVLARLSRRKGSLIDREDNDVRVLNAIPGIIASPVGHSALVRSCAATRQWMSPAFFYGKCHSFLLIYQHMD
jgi:hypothetical protein